MARLHLANRKGLSFEHRGARISIDYPPKIAIRLGRAHASAAGATVMMFPVGYRVVAACGHADCLMDIINEIIEQVEIDRALADISDEFERTHKDPA